MHEKRGKMEQSIIIKLPRIKEIDTIRKKHDPNFKFIENHITLVFPFKNVNQKKLIKHIQNSIKNIRPFKIILKGLKKSKKEYYLYLLIKEGKEEILQIHRNLYSTLLGKWLKKDIPYVPHLTLGIFKTKKDLENALKIIKRIDLNFEILVSKISLITLNKNLSIKSEKKFKLK